MWLKVFLTFGAIAIFLAGFILGHFAGFCIGSELKGQHDKDSSKPARS